MTIDADWAEALARLTSGSAKFVPSAATAYNPRHCLAIYHAPPIHGPTLELPTLLVGDVLGCRSGLGCTLLSPLPKKPPAGSILLGVWDDIRKSSPAILKGVPKPPVRGYHIHIGAHVLLVARHRSDVVAGLQTLAQLLGQYEGDHLPAGRVEDIPTFAVRSLYFNPGRQPMRLQPMTRLLGVPFAFKGSRLHVRFNDAEPVGDRWGTGRMEKSEAAEFATVCDEYGIELVPHVPWLSRWGVDPDARLYEDCRRLAMAFNTERIGLYGAWSPGGVERFRTYLEKTVRHDNTPYGFVLSSETAQELIGGDAREKWAKRAEALGKDRVCALEFWGGEESVKRLSRLKRAGIPGGMVVETRTWGFAVASPAQTEERLARGLKAAKEAGAEEFGYGQAEWDWGRLQEMELLPSTAALIFGWLGKPGSVDCVRQSAQLVYGPMGERVLQWMERLAQMFATLLPKPDDRWLLSAAFGFWPADADPAEAGRDLARVEEECRQLSEGLRQLRRKLSRNAQTLELFDYGLSALTLLAAQAKWLPEANRRYLEARGGVAGAARASRQALEALLEAFRPFALRTERIFRERGILMVEAESITWRIGKLEKVHEELSKLERLGPDHRVD